MAKNTIYLWYDKEAEAAARFYAETFPDSAVGAIHREESSWFYGRGAGLFQPIARHDQRKISALGRTGVDSSNQMPYARLAQSSYRLARARDQRASHAPRQRECRRWL